MSSTASSCSREPTPRPQAFGCVYSRSSHSGRTHREPEQLLFVLGDERHDVVAAEQLAPRLQHDVPRERVAPRRKDVREALDRRRFLQPRKRFSLVGPRVAQREGHHRIVDSCRMETELLAWFDAHGADLPWRRTRDPYAILVSEVMLQQTQVSRVAPRYEAWLERWPDVHALAAASPAEVIREWQGLGYNRRGLNLHRAARHVAEHGWPDDLTELPGVGPYTAAAVRAFAFGDAVLPRDTNVLRIEERTGHSFDPSCGQALMDLGRTICLARVPRCDECPLAEPVPVPRPALRAAAQAVALRGLVPPAAGGDAAPRRRVAAPARGARRRGGGGARAGRSRRHGERDGPATGLAARRPVRRVPRRGP